MITLQENTVQFNNDLIVSHNGGQLSSDSGLTLMDELMNAFQYSTMINEFNDYPLTLFHKENRSISGPK